MTYSLAGRLQTRLVLVTAIGALWAGLITPILPTRLALAPSYAMAFTVLGLVVALGLLWELFYHFLQQFRWDKDWPMAFTLVAGVSEGLVIWWLLATGSWIWHVPVTPRAFWLLFGSTWLLVCGVLHGPIRVLLTHWRWHGGRLWG